MTDLKKQLVRLEQDEALLQFDHFSNEDAWLLGKMLVETAKEKCLRPAFEITVNGYTVFRYGFSGTNLHNEQWLRRKRNTVQITHMSSLRAGTLLLLNNENIEKDWYLSEADHAVLGGGFPLILRGSGVVGCICCSGLPHEQDHQIVVDTIAAYLGVELPYKKEGL